MHTPSVSTVVAVCIRARANTTPTSRVSTLGQEFLLLESSYLLWHRMYSVAVFESTAHDKIILASSMMYDSY